MALNFWLVSYFSSLYIWQLFWKPRKLRSPKVRWIQNILVMTTMLPLGNRPIWVPQNLPKTEILGTSKLDRQKSLYLKNIQPIMMKFLQHSCPASEREIASKGVVVMNHVLWPTFLKFGIGTRVHMEWVKVWHYKVRMLVNGEPTKDKLPLNGARSGSRDPLFIARQQTDARWYS